MNMAVTYHVATATPAPPLSESGSRSAINHSKPSTSPGEQISGVSITTIGRTYYRHASHQHRTTLDKHSTTSVLCPTPSLPATSPRQLSYVKSRRQFPLQPTSYRLQTRQ